MIFDELFVAGKAMEIIMKIFTNEWYKSGQKTNEAVKNYFKYMKNHLPEWYNEFSVHDNKIKQAVQTENLLILVCSYDDWCSTEYQFIFHKPTIIENCELVNAWCLVDELYISETECEYHLHVEDSFGNSNYFTVKCSDIEFKMNGRSYRVFGENSRESIFKKDFELSEETILNEELKKIDALMQSSDKNKIIMQDADGVTITFLFNEDKTLSSKLYSDGNAVYYTYDSNGNIIRAVNIVNNRTEYIYLSHSSDGKILIAKLKDNCKENIPLEYDENLDCFDIIKSIGDNSCVEKK